MNTCKIHGFTSHKNNNIQVMNFTIRIPDNVTVVDKRIHGNVHQTQTHVKWNLMPITPTYARYSFL